jgi:hypothetical protein
MEFFQSFAKTYNEIFEKNKLAKKIPPSEEEWIEFMKKIDSVNKEELYMTILHYHFLSTKKHDELPYSMKLKNNELIINYKYLPSELQHIIISMNK